jgi:hypothetical protein
VSARRRGSLSTRGGTQAADADLPAYGTLADHWIHSHEEDSDDVPVFRRERFAFPVSFGAGGVADRMATVRVTGIAGLFGGIAGFHHDRPGPPHGGRLGAV